MSAPHADLPTFEDALLELDRAGCLRILARLDPALWTEVGADAMGFSASDAIALVRRLGGAGEGAAEA